MKTPHKHAELIKAWADGALIQCIDPEDSKDIWKDAECPVWFEEYEYRIKPEVKPDQGFHMEVGFDQDFKYPYMRRPEHYERPNLHLVFDGETGKLKSVEVV